MVFTLQGLVVRLAGLAGIGYDDSYVGITVAQGILERCLDGSVLQEAVESI